MGLTYSNELIAKASVLDNEIIIWNKTSWPTCNEIIKVIKNQYNYKMKISEYKENKDKIIITIKFESEEDEAEFIMRMS